MPEAQLTYFTDGGGVSEGFLGVRNFGKNGSMKDVEMFLGRKIKKGFFEVQYFFSSNQAQFTAGVDILGYARKSRKFWGENNF